MIIKKAEITKEYLLDKRAELMLSLSLEGYNMADIGKVFSIDRSGVLRILTSFKKSLKGKHQLKAFRETLVERV